MTARKKPAPLDAKPNASDRGYARSAAAFLFGPPIGWDKDVRSLMAEYEPFLAERFRRSRLADRKACAERSEKNEKGCAK